MTATAYRFTETDETAIRARLAEVGPDWRRPNQPPGSSAYGSARDTLIRVGAHAVGCGVHDLTRRRARLDRRSSRRSVGTMTLPDATPNPCDDCPWRRVSTRGWLGPFTAKEWVVIAHSDEPVACHKTITVYGEWAPGTLQCRGLAIFRENICKSPRDPEVITGPLDRERVFGWHDQFLEYHDSPLADWLAERREDADR